MRRTPTPPSSHRSPGRRAPPAPPTPPGNPRGPLPRRKITHSRCGIFEGKFQPGCATYTFQLTLGHQRVGFGRKALPEVWVLHLGRRGESVLTPEQGPSPPPTPPRPPFKAKTARGTPLRVARERRRGPPEERAEDRDGTGRDFSVGGKVGHSPGPDASTRRTSRRNGPRGSCGAGGGPRGARGARCWTCPLAPGRPLLRPFPAGRRRCRSLSVASLVSLCDRYLS